MYRKNKAPRLVTGAVAVIAMALGLWGCAPQVMGTQTEGNTDGGSVVTRGEWQPFDPQVEVGDSSGTAIEGSEEEQLQQERIAGGAVGAVVSKNLEPLVGITDYSEGDYEPLYGDAMQAPAMVHSSYGRDCVSCHLNPESQVQAPRSHSEGSFTNDDCASCHVQG